MTRKFMVHYIIGIRFGGGNICPTGWHVPNDQDWKQLEMTLGMDQATVNITDTWRGVDEGGKLKETGFSHWANPNTGATNFSGFTAIPGGARESNGNFVDRGKHASYWASDPYPYLRGLYYEYSTIVHRLTNGKIGLSIRCVKD